MKIKWKVSPAPTGRYRAFENRAWPMAEYANSNPAAMISCEDEYKPDLETHAELTVWIACYHDEKPGFDWRKMKARFKTLDKAKQAAQICIDAHPEHQPKEST